MRPIRLTVQGLTSYREPVEVDFTGLELFAITGPTGAGKSSLVDAITYALFGEVPRVGNSIKQLISQGQDRLKVTFEFASSGRRYRIHRSSSAKGASPIQFERYDETAADWMPETDRARDATREVEQVLGMDYDGFVRSVLLPQGQFQQFLAGKPEERRKVLDGLLQLHVYQRMQQRANERRDRHEAEAQSIDQILDTEYAEATAENLKEAKASKKELEAQERELQEQQTAVEGARRAAEGLSKSLQDRQRAQEALDRVTRDLKKAQDLLKSGESDIQELDERIKSLRQEQETSDHDSDLESRLNRCLPILREIERLTENETKLTTGIASAKEDLSDLEDTARAAADAWEAARKAAVVQSEEYDRARQTNASALLRQDLKPGDPCPVCGQPVGDLEDLAHLDLVSIRDAKDAAEKEEKKAQQAKANAESNVAVKQQELKGLEDQLSSLTQDIARRKGDAAPLLPEPGLSADDVDARIKTLEAARKHLETLKSEEERLVRDRENRANAIENARNDVTRLEAEAKSHETARSEAEHRAGEARSALRQTAQDLDWDSVTQTIDSDRDPARIIEDRLSTVRAEAQSIGRDIGAQAARIERIEEGIKKAKEMRELAKQERQSATLARDLASLLRSDRFQAFVREQALRLLAEDGSRRLNQISQQRYDFAVREQEFFIIDHWNADEQRSVKTLSGGETFLASLALALALAERIPALSAAAHGARLESLFIDEGFSHLDDESLDQVATALEELGQGGNRLVGVITHLPALAERIPTRIRVHKSQTGSTVSIE